MSSPIPSDKEGLIPDRLISNETVNKRAVQVTRAARVTARTSAKAVRQTGVAAKGAGQRTAAATKQSLQKAEARLQQKHGLAKEQAPANRTNHRQQAKEAKMMAKHAAHNQKSNVQSKGRGMSRG